MTEYEIASLALEQASGIREQIALAHSQLGLVQENLSVFLTLLFGYLIVAYLVAKSLTSVQVVILNFLYLVIMSFSLLAVFTAHGVGIFRYGGLLLLNPDTMPIEFWRVESQVALAAVLVIVVAVSIWFMWDVRHSKAA
jgi:hypothetical protein